MQVRRATLLVLRFAAVGGVAALGACLEAGAAAASDSHLPDAEAGTPDGTPGWARVKTVRGVELLPYLAYRGHAIYQDDVDLGPIVNVDARLYGAAVPSTGERWPGGEVDFAFHPSFPAAARAAVLAAIGDLEVVLPVDFHEVAHGKSGAGWIEFKVPPADAPFDAATTGVGMIGCAPMHCSAFDGCRADCGQWVYLRPDAGGAVAAASVKHQLLHALGVWHEHARRDRGDHVEVDAGCTATGRAEQLAHHAGTLDVGPYDYASIMHGASRAACIADPTAAADPYLGGCACLPMTKDHDRDGDGRLDAIVPGADLSAEDVNGVWHAYARELGTGVAGDALGRTVAVGDFDGDGYGDVATGAPGDDVVAADAGAVYVFKGTSNRLVPWKALSELEVRAAEPGAGDRFGAALAAGDVDGDGFDDLVVGAPDEDVRGSDDAGVVYVFRGGRGGLRFAAAYAHADVGDAPVAGARFGTAVAIGRVRGTGGGAADVIVGAPGDAVAARGRPSRIVRGGAVYVLPAGVGGATMHAASAVSGRSSVRLALPGAADGDHLGAALAVGQLDGDGAAELAVGAPGNGGRVAVYAGGSLALRQVVARGGRPGRNDRFGAAVLIADVARDARAELVVGAPGAAAAAGRVYVYAARDGAAPLALAHSLHRGRAAVPGDEFGAAVAAYQRDTATDALDLVVGAPGAGAIVLHRGVELSHAVTSPIAAGTRFGAALATGALDRLGDDGSTDDPLTTSTTDLVVGVPGEPGRGRAGAGATGGAITVFLGGGAGTLVGARGYGQESAASD